MSAFGATETNLKPVFNAFGGSPSETFKSDMIVDLLRRLVVVCYEQHHVLPSGFFEPARENNSAGWLGSPVDHGPEAEGGGGETHNSHTRRTSLSAQPFDLHRGLVYTLVIAATFSLVRVHATIDANSWVPSDMVM